MLIVLIVRNEKNRSAIIRLLMLWFCLLKMRGEMGVNAVDA